MTKTNKQKADYGTGKTPGHFCVIPQRAVIDPKFKQYPRTFMVLCALGNYTSRQGVCWPNQSTIAKNLGIRSQSTVSKHIKKLIEWDYIRYARKHPGLKGNKYFMVFDPKIKEEDAIATATVNERSFEEKPELHIGPLQGKKTTSSMKKEPTKSIENKEDKADIPSSEYLDIHSEGMHNNKMNNDIFPKARMICNMFVRLSERIYGQVRSYDQGQLDLVADWVQNKNLNPDYAMMRMEEVMLWRKKNLKDSPKGMRFFEYAFFKKPKAETKQEEAADILKRFINSRKIK